jgi:hypothetical protein
MKKIKIFAALLVLGVTLFQVTAYLSSCQKKVVSEEIEATKLNLLGSQFDAVNISDYSTTNASKNVGLSRDENLVKNSLYADLVNNTFTTLLTKLKSEILGDFKNTSNNTIALIIFSNNGTSINNNNEIQAITTLERINDKLKHRIYKVQNGNSVEVTKFYALTDYITHSDIKKELDELTTVTNLAGWVMVTDYTKIQQLQITHKIKSNDNLSLILLSNTNKVAEAPKGCAAGPGCGNDKNSACHWDGSWYCQSSGEKIFVIYDSIKYYNLASDAQNLSFDSSYDFRDNFMDNYAIGQKYINYYYKLSNVGDIYDVVKLNNVYDWFIFTKNVFSVANKLQYGNSSDIIVDSNFKTSAIAKINEYRALNTNAEMQAILNDIEADLNNFLGKTRAQILTEIQ